MRYLNQTFYCSKQKLGGVKSRLSNFELLRIICMLMIIAGHVIMVHGYGEIGSSSWYIGQILRSYVCIAVDVFVLISGYFGIKLNYSKLININTMVTFYSVLFLIIALASGIHTFSPRRDWMQLFPVVTKQYWFITIYFVLCLLSPYLNRLIANMSKESYQSLLLTCAMLFVVLPTFGFILNFNSVTEDAGYGIVNFCFLYLLGRYLKLHYIINMSRKWYLIIALVSTTLLGLFHLIYSVILGFQFTSLHSYDTIFCFLGAVSLFLYFKELNFSCQYINNMAKYVLSVYVLHLNPVCYEFVFNKVLHFNEIQGVNYVLLIIGAPLVIFIICSTIEHIRLRVFSIVNSK